MVLKPGSVVQANELLAHATQHIAEAPAVPRRIDIVDALPLTAIGKVFKPALRIQASERVIRAKLAAHELTRPLHVQGCITAQGLWLEFDCESALRTAEAEAALKAAMAPFAIAWRWRDGDGDGPALPPSRSPAR